MQRHARKAPKRAGRSGQELLERHLTNKQSDVQGPESVATGVRRRATGQPRNKSGAGRPRRKQARERRQEARARRKVREGGNRGKANNSSE